ncbi:MAG: hypothetical protein GWP61_22170 [Chloroflexi bacterium]|nr:hypothetical protein [Chloroflexota bacterium]
MIKLRFITVFFVFLAGIFLAGCGASTQSGSRAELITCHTAYRSDVGRPIEREDTFVFRDVDEQQEILYEELALHGQYGSGEMDNERALRLWVTMSGESDPILVQLYQLPQDSGPQNQFVGGHGFSGLIYVTHPVSGAEMQFWCEAS